MVFNSLGSNYNLAYVVKSFFTSRTLGEGEKLKKFLNTKYDGKPVLLYKGREAIKLALDLCQFPKGSRIGVNGLTCFVVYEAVVEAGCIPVYIDIDKSLNFSSKALEKVKNLKAIIIQNTLGNPVDIAEIKKYCSKNKTILIEDLAHSVGTLYSNGMEAGKIGDFTTLSFSQDKIIDGVSGGALIVRNKKFNKGLKEIQYFDVSSIRRFKDRLYPILTYKVRCLYRIGLGRGLHFLLKKIKVLSQPIGGRDLVLYHRLPHWYSFMINYKFSSFDSELRHRRKIARIYMEIIDKSLLSNDLNKNINQSSNIRYPIFTENRNGLVTYLKSHRVYVSDIWYDAPIAPRRMLAKTSYQGECPMAEQISKQVSPFTPILLPLGN